MKRTTTGLSAILASLSITCTVLPLKAATIMESEFLSWATVVTYETAPTGIYDSPFIFDGLTHTANVGGIQLSNDPIDGGLSGISWIAKGTNAEVDILLPFGMTQAGLRMGKSSSRSATIEFYDGVSLLHSQNVSITNGTTFVGFENPTGTISRLRVIETGSFSMAFDDVTFAAVPEPSSTALLGLGGLALMLRRRR